MPPVHAASVRSTTLAFWLSLLALCSALLAPASVLAQEARSGQWGGLCSMSGPSSAHPDGQASGEGGHCGLCVLPLLAPPPAVSPASQASGPAQAPAAGMPVVLAAAPAHGPFIRGPPPEL